MIRAAGTLAFALIAVTACGDDKAAWPTTGGADAAAMFAELDANQDGQLSADEVAEERQRLFDRLVRRSDRNGDEKLTAEEFAAGLQGGRVEADEPATPEPSPRESRPGDGRFFDRLDADGNGKVSPDEVPEERREGFKKLVERGDKDGDGALDRQELSAAFAGGRDAESKRPERPGEPGRFFERLDANKDGKVTADEAPEPVRPRIEALVRRADKNGDGAVTREEFRAFGPPTGRRPDADDKTRQQPGQESEKLPPGKAAQRPRPVAGIFGALDADGDGQLSSSEIDDAPQAIRKLDADSNGKVDMAEVVKSQPMRKKGNK